MTSMKLRTLPVGAAAVAAALACSSGPVKADQKPGTKPADARPVSPAPKPAPAKSGPVGEKAQLLREAADQLEKAGAQLERGNKNLAEQLFSPPSCSSASRRSRRSPRCSARARRRA